MKTTNIIFKTVLVALSLSLLLQNQVSAQETQNKYINPATTAPVGGDGPLTVSLRTSFVSSYYYRGLALYPGASLQPSAGVFYNMGSLGNIGGSVWMQIPLEDSQQTFTFFDVDGNEINQDFNQKFFELDPTISYDISFDKLTLSAGHIWYTDPGYGDDTFYVNDVEQNIGERAPDSAEFYAGAGLDVIGQPQLTIYYDYRTLEYFYYSLGLSHNVKIPAFGEDFNFTPFAVFGFAGNASDDILIYNRNGLEHVNVGVTTTLKWGIFQVKPNFTYVFGTDKEVDGFERTSNEFIVGLDIAYDFNT